MIDFPTCKINLGLRVLRKRGDGYHDLETCFYPIPWMDILEIIPAQTTRLDITGLPIPADAPGNIVLKAFKLLQGHFGLSPVHIHLHKIIPHGAGLGGGSSDGAYALKLLNEIFKLNLTVESLREYALMLGSDCPFFLGSTPMLASGRGEVLKPVALDLSGLRIAIVKPSFSVSTADAYASIHPKETEGDLETVLREPVSKWKAILKNDFEDSVFPKYPRISEIKNKLYQVGAVYASMSGSGSSVYGLFESDLRLEEEFKDSTVWQAKL